MEDGESRLFKKLWDKARELRDALMREGDTYAILILKRSFIPAVDEVETALEVAKDSHFQPKKEEDDGDHDIDPAQDQGLPPPPQRGPAP